MEFGERELIGIRHLILLCANPDDDALSRVSLRDPKELRKICRRHLRMITDPSVPISQLASVLNANIHPPKSPPHVTDPPAPISPVRHLGLPPKVRDKPLVSRKPTTTIPTLPRLDGGRATADRPLPTVGSLAAVIYPTFGPALVCRVVADRSTPEGTRHFLVAFFQPEPPPCWIAANFIFQVSRDRDFPLGDDNAFSAAMTSGPVSADWILERILSAAQNLILNHRSRLQSRNNPIMFQCVSYAALLVFCHVVTNWEIPPAKKTVILETILRANPIKYISTLEVVKKAEAAILRLTDILTAGDR